MASRMLQTLVRRAAVAGVVGLAFASSADARPLPGVRPVRATRGFSLFAGSPTLIYQVNRVNCGIVNNGTACLDLTGSPVAESGLWPAGSPDNYVFNSGLQIAAFIPGAKTATFPWPGDTVGAFFFDPRGDQHHGEGVTNIFNAGNADDLANWPSAAGVNDTALYNSALIGRQTLSQQDLWFRIWDGNTTLTAGRKHTMGLLVDERWLGWNFPSGNQDILYVIVRFINITSNIKADYTAGLSPLGYSAGDIDEIYATAQNYRASSQAFYNVVIPDSGFWWTNVVASYAADPDEGDAGRNYSTANLIFNSVINYKSDFREPTWQFPPSIFSAPFAAAPGFFGMKYLASPNNLGITMSGNTTNGGQFPDAVGVPRLWRNLTGNLLSTDGTCSVPQPQTRRQCFWASAPSDTRIFAASGTFTIKPGQAATIVAALVWAAPVATLPAATPVGVSNSLQPVIPAFSLATWIGNDNMKSPFGLDGLRLATNLDSIKPVDRAMGLVNYGPDANGNGQIDPTEITTVPRSFLDKENVAQAVFNSKFLLPFAPDAPQFFLVPGDGQVTVAWQASGSEATGNPFFQVASAPLVTCPGGVGQCANSLYDPDFRKFDVEGYRIYRGRSRSEMQVIASFDYSGTTFVDYTAQVFNSDFPNCAPEIGLNAAPACDTTGGTFAFDIPASAVNVNTSPHRDWDIGPNLVQVPPGGRVQLADGSIFTLQADTAVTGGGSGFPALTDNGVPFAYTDKAVLNGVRYFYAVTAFMVNSVKSGPSSLESPLVTKTVIPRVPSTNNQAAVVVLGQFRDDGTTAVDPTASFPSIDAANGTLNGLIPPANGGVFKFLASVAEALPPGDFGFRVDSVSPGFGSSAFGPTPTLYGAFFRPDSAFVQSVSLPMPTFSASTTTFGTYSFSRPLVPYDTARAALVGISNAFASVNRMPVEFDGTVGALANTSPAVALASGRYGATGTNQGSRFLAHSYWFDEGSSPPADPTIDPFGSVAHSAGKLTGIATIYAPMVYRQPITGGSANREIDAAIRGAYAAGAGVWYPADFVVTWGAAGAVTVRDTSNGVTLPFKRSLEPGYGFLDLAAMVTAGVTAGQLADGGGTPSMTALAYEHIGTINPVCGNVVAVACVPLRATAASTGIDLNSDGASDGNGFALAINGEVFYFIGAIPASGTKWHLTAYGGGGMTASCTPALPASGFINPGSQPTDCSSYSYTPPSLRPAFAPGMQYKIRVTQAFSVAAAAGDLSRIHTVPDPYYVTNSLEQTVNTKILRFVNLPNQAIIRIYSSSGILVDIITHNDPGGSGEQVWDLRNRNQQFVASGVYFYHVEAADGSTKIGRFTVVNYAQ